MRVSVATWASVMLLTRPQHLVPRVLPQKHGVRATSSNRESRKGTGIKYWILFDLVSQEIAVNVSSVVISFIGWLHEHP